MQYHWSMLTMAKEVVAVMVRLLWLKEEDAGNGCGEKDDGCCCGVVVAYLNLTVDTEKKAMNKLVVVVNRHQEKMPLGPCITRDVPS